jgi:hypothetical protein
MLRGIIKVVVKNANGTERDNRVLPVNPNMQVNFVFDDCSPNGINTNPINPANPNPGDNSNQLSKQNLTSINLRTICSEDGKELNRTYTAIREGDIDRTGKTPATINIPGGTDKGEVFIEIENSGGEVIQKTINSYTKSQEVTIELLDCAKAGETQNRFEEEITSKDQIRVQAVCEETGEDLIKEVDIYRFGTSKFTETIETPEVINIPRGITSEIIHIRTLDGKYQALRKGDDPNIIFSYANCK